MKKILLSILTLISTFSYSQTIAIQSFATGLSSAVEIVHPPNDARLFAVQQGGLIRIVNPNGTINATPFLNLTSIITSGGERGLLGLAFHPNYATNGQFFVNYTNTSGNTVIARYTVSTTNPDVANSTGTILMTITQPYSNHNGGCIRFGPDGYLYIGMGDGGSAGDPGNRAQNINENLGKMLRIDVDNPTAPLNYGIPPTNPYVGIAGNDEIWAIGVRNPWKFSFNRLNGDLWIADVGQNQVEEINKIVAPQTPGLNFGWKCYEGSSPYSTSAAGCPSITALTMPIAEYSHSQGCSITGGYEYTGTMYPNFSGKYFFADYCENRIGYVNSTTGVITYTPYFTGSNNFVTFGEDVNGELYISKGNIIYKIVDTTQLANSSFEANQISMFPNPANSEFAIQNKSGKDLSTVKVFDVSGKLLISQNIESTFTKVSISTLNSGLYLVTIEAKNGEKFTSKLMVE